MKVGDRYLHRHDKREAHVVGCNDEVVEYRYVKLAESQGKGVRTRRLNVMTMDRERFDVVFEALT